MEDRYQLILKGAIAVQRKYYMTIKMKQHTFSCISRRELQDSLRAASNSFSSSFRLSISCMNSSCCPANSLSFSL